MFTSFSKTQAGLTFARENANFRRTLPDGVYSGFLAYPDATTTDFRLSIQGGFLSFNGVLWQDDADSVDVLNLDAPGGSSRHFLIWVDFSSGDGVYSFKEGTLSAMAELDAGELANGIKIADVRMPSTATSIQDCQIINVGAVVDLDQVRRELSRSFSFSPRSIQVVESSGTYTLHLENPRLLVFGEHRNDVQNNEVVGLPFTVHTVNTGTASTVYTGGDGFEISKTPGGDEWIVFYVDDSEGYVDGQTDLVVKTISFARDVMNNGTEVELGALLRAASDPANETMRQEAQNIKILAVVDVDTAIVNIHTLGSIPVGEEYSEGYITSQINTLTSSGYGTGPISPTLGDLDLDNLIPNSSKLVSATLDTGYDGFDDASSPGDGREITVDVGPVQLNQVIDDEDTPDDRWFPALRIVQNSDGASNALTENRGIDIAAIEDISDRKALTFRSHANIKTNTCVSTLTTYTVSGSNITVTDFGTSGPDFVDFGREYDVDVEAGFYYVEITGTGAACDDRIFRLQVDPTGTFFILETTDGLTAIDGLFPAGPTFDAVTTLWEEHVSVGRTTELENLVVRNNLSGPDGVPLRIANYNLEKPVLSPGEFIDTLESNTTATVLLGDTAGEFLDSNAAVEFKTGIDTDAVSICADEKYVYVASQNGSGVPITVRRYDAESGTAFGSNISTSNNAASASEEILMEARAGQVLAISFDNFVEEWDVSGATPVLLDDYSLPGAVTAVSLRGNSVFIGHRNGSSLNVSLNNGTATAALTSTAHDVMDLDVFGNRLVAITSNGGAYSLAVANCSGNDVVELRSILWSAISGSAITVPAFVTTDGYFAWVLGTDGSLDWHIEKYSLVGETYVGSYTLTNPLSSLELDAADNFIVTIKRSIHFRAMNDNRVYLAFSSSGTYDRILIMDHDLNVIRHEESESAVSSFESSAFNGRTIFTYDGVGDRLVSRRAREPVGMYVYSYNLFTPFAVMPAGGQT